MFGLDMLDVLIGLVTVYLAFGLACTAIVEALAAWFNVRSKNLEDALNEFLAGDIKEAQKFVTAFYDHPLVQSLSKGKDGRPSYIPPSIVGQVVESIVTANGTALSLADAINLLPGTPETNRVKGLLSTLVVQAKGDAAVFRVAVETHFDIAMDRASGWFKRYTQNVALVVSALLVIGANVDTLSITTSLAESPAARAKMVEIAEQQLTAAKKAEDQAASDRFKNKIDEAKKKTDAALATLERAASNMESAGLRFGWKDSPMSFFEILAKLAGLLISILSISLGAPFWFDMLKSIMQVRSTGVSPREQKK